MYKIVGADQKEYGPVGLDQLRQWATEGRVNGQTLVQAEGTTGWMPLSSYPELASLIAAVPAAPLSAPAPASLGAPLAAQPRAELPNYLVQAILCTLCCCLPTGIAAIVYAAQVNTKLAAGDIAGAEASSKNAKMWCWISVGLGVAWNVVVLVMYLGAFASRIR